MYSHTRWILVATVAAICGACGRDNSSESFTSPASAPEPTTSPAQPAIAEVVPVERFEIRGKLDGNVLTFTLDTDLPSTAIVMASVDRSYAATSSQSGTETYRPRYWERRATVEALRTPQTIRIDDQQWAAMIEVALEVSARENDPMKIQSVDQAVTVELTVPLSGQSPPLAPNADNMTGKMVIVESRGHIIHSELSFPSKLTAPVKTQRGWLDWR
jgi:hypothetical protein